MPRALDMVVPNQPRAVFIVLFLTLGNSECKDSVESTFAVSPSLQFAV